jgi:hypothetical protein
MPELPKTIATVVDAKQARSIADHIEGALAQGAPTILLYTTLNPMVEDPQELSDFPVPDLHVFETVYVIGVAQPFEDYLAQLSEHSDHIEKSEDQ